eukprot:TRINITY_DN2272_c0_g1_i1.p1 TRINITY_DN2272_c0_g1~~TRINITY_DN2272_c0_g1_i1.p1  ORF type:complete len:905 (+),score=207.46 TRINITY_DN2272_c0_g1_i1:120-2834(+)
MIRRPPRSTLSSSSAASDVYKRQEYGGLGVVRMEGRQSLLQADGECACECSGGSGLSRDAVREVFDMFDISGDGEISYIELKSAIRSISPDIRSAEIKLLFNQANVDKKNDISFDEFEAVLVQVRDQLVDFGQSGFVASVSKAAEHIVEAFVGEERPGLRNCVQARKYYHMVLRAFWVKRGCAIVLVLLTFFEMPAYCLNAAVNEGRDACHADHELYPTFGLPMLRPSEAAGINYPCLLFLAGDIWLHSKVYTWAVLWKIWRQKLECLIVAGLLVNGFYQLVAESSSHVVGITVEPILRLGYCVLLSRPMCITFRNLLLIFPKFLKIIVLVAIFLVLYTALGCLLFAGSPEGSKYFGSFGDGLWNLLILLTTANNPDVMMPAYNDNRSAAIFFVSFVLIGIFFLLNFILAVVFNEYAAQVTRTTEECMAFREQKLTAAFNLLRHKSKAYITESTTIAVFKELYKFRSRTPPSTDVLDVMFAILDSTGDKRIYEHEFTKLCTLMQLQFARLEPPFLETWFPALADSPTWASLKSIKTIERVNLMVDAGLVLMLVLSVGYGLKDGYEDEAPAVKFFSCVVMLLMLCEQSFKVMVRGLYFFWRRPLNRFDGIMTVIATVVTLFVAVPGMHRISARYLVALQMIRLIRLMRHVEAWTLLLEVVNAGQRPAMALACVLLSIMFLFGSVGIQIFGGKINTDPESQYSRMLSGTDFADAQYWANNFNDLGSAMVTLFSLIVVNNWFVIVDGMVAVTSAWSKVYFIAFWVIGVVFFFNVVIGFVLDVFHSEYVCIKQVVDFPGGKVSFKNGVPVGVFEVEEVIGAAERLSTSPTSPTLRRPGSYRGKNADLTGRYIAGLQPGAVGLQGFGHNAHQAFVDLFKREDRDTPNATPSHQDDSADLDLKPREQARV